MTRINCGVPPIELSDRHLLAEHREIKRVPNAVARGRCDLRRPLPEAFSLGAGHVRFFYDKLGHLLARYLELRAECLRRGFAVTDFSGAWEGVDPSLMGGYVPTPADTALVRTRIAERTP